MGRVVRVSRHYPQPIERVWYALTDAASLSAWLMPTDFQPVLHHQFTFQTKPQPGFDGVVRCEVVELNPPRRLAYTWQGGPMKQPTLVRWQLTPQADGTLLELEHSGFAGVSGWLVSWVLGSGWKSLLTKTFRKAVEAYG